jgi:restriction system protein
MSDARRVPNLTVPKYDDLLNPVLRAIRELGGSASIAEVDERVTRDLGLSEEDLSRPHKNGRETELEYRLARARTYLKAYGLLNNSGRGVWALTPKGRDINHFNSKDVVRCVRQLQTKRKKEANTDAAVELAEASQGETWREELLRLLLRMPADAFERLSQRLLRESGFTQVNVTGRSGDGGIDGTGHRPAWGVAQLSRPFPVQALSRQRERRRYPGLPRRHDGTRRARHRHHHRILHSRRQN